MNRIEEIDPYSSTMTVEAGVLLQTIQEQAQTHGLLFPLDLGARGSCTIGGNLSTNAGGNRVIRYGMTRDLVVGVEAVLADGTIIDGLHKLRKNNTGYDLKQLFIGSEGTLGLITKAVIKLTQKPNSQAVAMCSVDSFVSVADLLVHCQATLGANLSAFEVIWQNSYKLIDEHMSHVTVPLDLDHSFYVLIESMGSDKNKDTDLFFDSLSSATEKNLIDEVVIADSDAKMKNLWAVRDSAAEVSTGVGYMHTYDVSLNVSDMGYFGEEVERRLRSQWPDAVLGLFGHIGDGNLHLNILKPDHLAKEIFFEQCAKVSTWIFEIVEKYQGSVSAEHGVGMTKKAYLKYTRSEDEIGYMRAIKAVFDPNNVMNPGKLIDMV